MLQRVERENVRGSVPFTRSLIYQCPCEPADARDLHTYYFCKNITAREKEKSQMITITELL